jgi:hypothetical protein
MQDPSQICKKANKFILLFAQKSIKMELETNFIATK